MTYVKAPYEVIHKSSDRCEASIILSKSIVTRIMVGFELEINIIILSRITIWSRNDYKKKSDIGMPKLSSESALQSQLTMSLSPTCLMAGELLY